MQSRDLLDDFAQYCAENPDQRFWQALRNWSGFNFVLVADNPEAKRYADDTFYWDTRNGLRRKIDVE